MSIGVVWIIIYILYRFSNKNKEGKSGDIRPSALGAGLFIWIVIFYASIIIVAVHNIWVVLLLLLVASPVLFPSLYAYLMIHCGLYRVAYYFGRISLLHYFRSPMAGALYCGFKAAMNIPKGDERNTSLRWLNQKLMNKKGKVFSGEIVMHTIINGVLQGPDQFDSFEIALKRLQGLGTVSIPKQISILASKYALAKPLAEQNWNAINACANHWDTPGTNRIAQFLKEYHGYYVISQRYFSRFKIWFYSLFLWRYPALRKIAKHELDLAPPMDTDVITIGALWRGTHRNKVYQTQLYEQLLGDTAKQQWQRRAQELGVWNFEDLWAQLIKQFGTCQPGTEEEFRALNDQEYAVVNHHMKSLVYLERALSKKMQGKFNVTGAESYMDWLRIIEALDGLSFHKHTQLSAFSRIHGTLWNWIADLWNKKKELCLVHFIANTCAPLARDSGHKDFYHLLSGLTEGRYR